LAIGDISTDAGNVSVGLNVTQAISQSPGAPAVAGDLHETHIHHNPLSDLRRDEFRRIDEFIVKKDEFRLRETFDFANLIKHNIVLARTFFGQRPSHRQNLMN
jgi:hypothetical protein